MQVKNRGNECALLEVKTVINFSGGWQRMVVRTVVRMVGEDGGENGWW